MVHTDSGDKVPGYWSYTVRSCHKTPWAGDVAQWYGVWIASTDPPPTKEQGEMVLSRIAEEVFTEVKEARKPCKGTCSIYRNRMHKDSEPGV